MLEDPEHVAFISQTTLSVDETRGIIERLRERFPTIVGPRTDDICYATTNRQAAVRELARECDLVLVIGSRNSSNSQRLVEVARDCGAPAHLIDNAGELDERWLDGVRTVGITSGRERTRVARPGARRRVPRARGHRHLGARGDARGRPLHASEDDSRDSLVTRTLVVSDLHLGTRAGVDVLAREGVRETLLSALEGVDRLILLGDTLELRQTTFREVIDRAAPALRAIGERLEGRTVVVVPGNHDHALAGSWLDRHEHPLGLENRATPQRASHAAQELAGCSRPRSVELAYPGLWVADGVYATHGHYLDLHMTVPTIERVAIAGSGRLTLADRRRWDDVHSPDEYEAVVAPLYAWLHTAAQSGRPSRGRRRRAHRRRLEGAARQRARAHRCARARCGPRSRSRSARSTRRGWARSRARSR